MDSNEVSSPGFRVAREPGGLRIRVPVRPEKFRTLLNLVWVVIWAVTEVAIILYMLGWTGPLGFSHSGAGPLAAVFLAVFTASGLWVMWRWLWRIGGQESFLVARNALWARREILGIGRTRHFAFGDIRNVRSARLKYRVIFPSWGRMFVGQGGSEIVIDCWGHTAVYGKGLEEGEAADLVALLEEEMGFQFHKPMLPKARTAFLI